MKEMDLCVHVTRAEWDALIATGNVFNPGEKGTAHAKNDIVYHDGKPYLCMKDDISFYTGDIGFLWKAIICVEGEFTEHHYDENGHPYTATNPVPGIE